MLLDDLDWLDVYARLDAWQALRPGAREAYAALRPSDQPRASTFGRDLAALVDAAFLVPTSGVSVRVHPDAKPIVRAFRLMVRRPVLERHDQATLAGYLAELLVAGERREMMAGVHAGYAHGSPEVLAEHVASIDWPRRFATPEPWDADCPDRALPAARRLTTELLDTPGPLSLRGLPDTLSDFGENVKWRAVNLALANLAVFPVFLDGTESLAEPGLALWPPAARRHFAPPPPAPAERTPERSWSGTVLVEDASTVLMAAAAEPLRVRQNDGRFYVRTVQDLEDGLAPLPEWLSRSVQGLDRESRLARARGLLEEIGLLHLQELSGGRLGLVPGSHAKEWIALGPKRRLGMVLDRWRRAEGFAPPPGGEGGGRGHSAVGGSMRDDGDGFDDLDDDLDQHPWFTPSPSRHGGYLSIGYTGRLHGDVGDLVSAVRDALRRVEGDGFVGLHDFAEYEAELHNPLDSDDCDLRAGWGWGRETAESRRRTWADELRAFVLNRLLMVGGARMGTYGEGMLVFETTTVGRYLVGLTDVLEIEVPDESGAVVVQPDFEVVFLRPAPEAEAATSRFAERMGHGVGVLFRLTPEAAYAAAAAGLTAERALETLSGALAQTIPPNVEHELRAWFGRARRLPVRRAMVVDCGDPEIARRLCSAGGGDVRILSDTVVEIAGGKIGRRLQKRAAAQGLFLAPP